jgi:hypothetical protein
MPRCRCVISRFSHIARNLRGSLESWEKPQEVLMNPLNLLRFLMRPPVSTEDLLLRRLDGLEGYRQVTKAPPVSVFSAPRRRPLVREGQPS